MRLILRAFGDPTLEGFLLFFGQRKVRVRRRHQIIGVTGKNLLAHQALIGFARNDGMFVGFFPLGVSLLGQIEAEAGFSRCFIGPMAFEAAV